MKKRRNPIHEKNYPKNLRVEKYDIELNKYLVLRSKESFIEFYESGKYDRILAQIKEVGYDSSIIPAQNDWLTTSVEEERKTFGKEGLVLIIPRQKYDEIVPKYDLMTFESRRGKNLLVGECRYGLFDNVTAAFLLAPSDNQHMCGMVLNQFSAEQISSRFSPTRISGGGEELSQHYFGDKRFSNIFTQDTFQNGILNTMLSKASRFREFVSGMKSINATKGEISYALELMAYHPTYFASVNYPVGTDIFREFLYTLRNKVDFRLKERGFLNRKGVLIPKNLQCAPFIFQDTLNICSNMGVDYIDTHKQFLLYMAEKSFEIKTPTRLWRIRYSAFQNFLSGGEIGDSEYIKKSMTPFHAFVFTVQAMIEHESSKELRKKPFPEVPFRYPAGWKHIENGEDLYSIGLANGWCVSGRQYLERALSGEYFYFVAPDKGRGIGMLEFFYRNGEALLIEAKTPDNASTYETPFQKLR